MMITGGDKTISGLNPIFYWKEGQLIYEDTGGTDPVEDGDKVERINDFAGGSVTMLTPYTATNNPYYRSSDDSIEFDGTDDYINIEYTGATVSQWVGAIKFKLDNVSGQQMLMARRSGTNPLIQVSANGADLLIQFRNSGTVFTMGLTSAFSSGVEYTLIVVFDTNTDVHRAYLDNTGSYDESTQALPDPSFSASRTCLGSYRTNATSSGAGAGAFFDGKIYACAEWHDTVLSTSDLDTIFAEL
jgi:hypothetical protein